MRSCQNTGLNVKDMHVKRNIAKSTKSGLWLTKQNEALLTMVHLEVWRVQELWELSKGQ